MADKMTYEVNIDDKEANVKLDNLINKAERLKKILLECEDYIESLDGDGLIQQPIEAQLSHASAQIVYTINIGDLMTILKTDTRMFSDEFNQFLKETLPTMLAPRPNTEPVKAEA